MKLSPRAVEVAAAVVCGAALGSVCAVEDDARCDDAEGAVADAVLLELCESLDDWIQPAPSQFWFEPRQDHLSSCDILETSQTHSSERRLLD